MLKKFIVTGLILGSIVIYSCTKDKGALPTTPLTDELLLSWAKDTTGKFLYTSGSGSIMFTSDNIHGARPYKLRMNKKAFDACTSGGKLPTGATFPDSSMLVKELRNTGTDNVIDQFAILYKHNGNWKWVEYKPDGTMQQKIADDASFCTSCHISNRDNVFTFDVHP
jgi:hypothetical protein